MTLTHLDLFSGIGGFALAAQWAGFSTVGFAEVDSFCTKVLKKHWPQIKNYGDVRNINAIGHLDLITGGFPCQPFSNAGKKKGTQDDRYLWPEFRRIIQSCHPRWVVAENVTGIVDMELDNILDDLENSGYETQSFVIPACALQAPHKRERVWIVAHSNRERCDNGFNHPKWRSLLNDWERDVKTLQENWAGFFPKSWKTFNFQNWFRPFTDSDGEQCSSQYQNQKAFAERFKRSDDTREVGYATRPATASRHAGQLRQHETQFNWQESQPPIPGVDDGIPDIVDRNKALGNAIVPQVVYPILRLIALLGGKQYG
jgi:DNA (cytosine-5)-methyltransferase 1